MMRVGIDASNLRGGGGITHLAALLAHTVPERHGLARVTVWGARSTLEQLPVRPWLEPAREPLLEGALASRFFWQYRRLPRLAKQKCDVLFAPGGSCTAQFRPVVTMSRNLLPFEPREMLRYAPSRVFARTLLLRRLQSRSMRGADGTIFLSEYARRTVADGAGVVPRRAAIIPHGIDERFFQPPREQRPMLAYSRSAPFRILYTSIIDLYKHPWNVVEAVARLRREGFPVCLDLVGPGYAPALRRLSRTLNRHDPRREFVHYHGAVPHADLPHRYRAADLFVFASTCENLPNILLEAMASGLPIACSDRGPMPEILGDGGVYFDPLDPAAIARGLRRMLTDPAARRQFAESAHRRARSFSWERCARETWAFLAEAAAAAGLAPARETVLARAG